MRHARWLAPVALIVVMISPGRAVLFDVAKHAWEWLGDLNGAETNSVTVRNAGLVVGTVVAFYLTWRRIRTADHQAQTAYRQLMVARDSLNEAEKSRSYIIHKDKAHQRNTEFHKGAEMLSSGEMFVRLAGIRILQDLATRYPDQFGWQTERMLSAFVEYPPRLNENSHGEDRSDRRPDVHRAASVLATLLEGRQERQ